MMSDSMGSEDSCTFEVGVCSWSLSRSDPDDLVTRLQATGINRIQLALDPLRQDPETWGNIEEVLNAAGISLASGMCTCVGEDYSTLDSIRTTGGIVPESTWEQNEANFRAAADIASSLKLNLVTFHAGFLPHDPGETGYRRMQERLRLLSDVFGESGIALALETGQETADTLRGFLENLDRSNVGVNFDPANMILYDKGDPIDAVGILGPWIRQTHIKDARRTEKPGTWGREMRVGDGEVDWAAFFEKLRAAGFSGDCCIEREFGPSRVEDISAARDHVQPFL